MNDIIDFYLIPKLDDKTLANFSMISRSCRRSCRLEVRRREVLRCASIYNWMPQEFHSNLRTNFRGCSDEETEILRQIYYDCYFRKGPPSKYNKYDPELCGYLAADMRMGAPPDLPLMYNFYAKVIKETGSL